MTRGVSAALAGASVPLTLLVVWFAPALSSGADAAAVQSAPAAPLLLAADAGDYADSVDRALEILRAAPADDRSAARRASDVLEAGTGQSQPEILGDLRKDPPDVADARDRLSALSQGTRSPAFAPEPGKARRAVHDILAQPRYAALRQGPTLSDRIRTALIRLVLWLLAQAAVAVAGGLWTALAAVGVVVLAAAVVVVARSARWFERPQARLSHDAAGGTRRRDRFLEADRLAAAGDYAGAIRELAGGVAMTLGDELAWEASPLTVRELFSRASSPASLRPLLLAFEAAVYGARPPDRETYQQAEAAAAPFRADRDAPGSVAA